MLEVVVSIYLYVFIPVFIHMSLKIDNKNILCMYTSWIATACQLRAER